MRPRWSGPAPCRPAALVLVLVCAAAALSACRVKDAFDSALSSSKFIYCTIMADAPDESAGKIKAPAHFVCDDPGPDAITLTVTLQKRGAGDTWTAIASQTFVVHASDTTRARTQGTRTRSVTAACSSGSFRTTVHAVEQAKGLTHAYDPSSITVPNPCR